MAIGLYKNSACSELILQVFLHSCRLIRNYETDEIQETGLTLVQAQRLEKMSIVDLQEMASLCSAAGVKVIAPSGMIDRLFDLYERKKNEETVIEKFIKGGATCQDMRQFFGLSKSQYIKMRKTFGLSEFDIGRFERPDEETEAMIWLSWYKNQKLEVRQRVLKVHMESGVKIRVIMECLKQAQETVA